MFSSWMPECPRIAPQNRTEITTASENRSFLTVPLCGGENMSGPFQTSERQTRVTALQYDSITPSAWCFLRSSECPREAGRTQSASSSMAKAISPAPSNNSAPKKHARKTSLFSDSYSSSVSFKTHQLSCFEKKPKNSSSSSIWPLLSSFSGCNTAKCALK